MTISHNTHQQHQQPDSDDAALQMEPVISEEAQDFIMGSDADSPGPYPLPPRIAARIYKHSRAAAYHRKSSAASSRRNSMTSHHSSRSSRHHHHAAGSSSGYTSGAQSNHVAQHLRRASIIESRRAKAADWNAHAEKVRLRAALIQAAPRSSVADSEERALAAQQAREKMLAQVKANCAAEVKRSKKIAEEQREKRQAAYLKMKADVEERHAQAQRRRALLEQSVRRTKVGGVSSSAEDSGAETGRSSGSSSGRRASKSRPAAVFVWKPRSQTEAATVVQRAWRLKHRRGVIQRFLDLGMTVDAVQKTDFDAVGERLNDADVIKKSADLLKIFALADETDSVVSGDPSSKSDQAAVRTFLSTFLILGHQSQVLNRDGEQERDLVSKANELLLVMNRLIATLNEGHSKKHSLLLKRAAPHESFNAPDAELASAHAAFQAAFAAWRSQDSSFMIKNMLAQFVELDAIWHSVKNDTAREVAADYEEGIRHNQTLVLIKLKKLAGPDRAMKMVKEAVRKSRKARAQKLAKQAKQPGKVVEDQNAPRAGISDSPTIPSSIQTEVQATQSATPADPSNVAETAFKATTLVPDSRIVVHELAITGEWKLDVATVEAKRDQQIEAFVTQLQAGLDAGLADLWIPAMAEAIRDKLCNMLPPDKPTANMVKEVLDPELMAQQVRNNAFSYNKFFEFMNNLLPTLCAPVRDAEVRALAQEPSVDPVRQIARVFFIVELLVLDMLNFQLVGVAPSLIKEAPGYEARAFNASLSGKLPERTYRWWRDSLASYSSAPATNAGGSVNSAQSPSPTKVYMTGLVDLAITTGVGKFFCEGYVPETLQLDVDRLGSMRADTLRLVTVAAILLNAKSLLRRDTRSLWKAEAGRMWDLLPVPGTSSGSSAFVDVMPPASAFVAIVESRYALPPTTKQQLTVFVTKILGEYVAQAGIRIPTASAASASTASSASSSRPSSSASSATAPNAMSTSTAVSSAESPSNTRQPPGLGHPVLKVLLKKLRTHILTRLSASSMEERGRLTSGLQQSSLEQGSNGNNGIPKHPMATGLALLSTSRSGTPTNTNGSSPQPPGAVEVLGSAGMIEFVGRVGDMADEVSRIARVDREAHGEWHERICREILGSPSS